MSKEKQPKNHHYVPRVYLKHFAKPKGKKHYTIFVCDAKQYNKVFPRNIEDIACEIDYNRVKSGKYLPEVPDNNELYYEEKFNELIEKEWDSIVRKLSASCTLSVSKTVLTEELKYSLSRFMMVQMMRTPSARQLTRKYGEKSSRKTLDAITPFINSLPRKDLIKTFNKMKREFRYTDEIAKSFHLSATTDEERIQRQAQLMVENRIWLVYKSPNGITTPFITSDNPIVVYNPVSNKYGIGPNGIDVRYSLFGFPVTPQFFVMTFHKESPIGIWDADIYDKCETVDSGLVMAVNKYQFEQCIRQVYLPPDLGELLMSVK